MFGYEIDTALIGMKYEQDTCGLNGISLNYQMTKENS